MGQSFAVIHFLMLFSSKNLAFHCLDIEFFYLSINETDTSYCKLQELFFLLLYKMQ